MTSDHGQPAKTFASIGIDIGKDVFHIVGFVRLAPDSELPGGTILELITT